MENESKEHSEWGSEPRATSPPVGDWIWDLTTQEMYWSEAMFKLLGMEADASQASYERLIEGVHPEDRVRFESWLQAVLLGEGRSMLQHRVNTHASVSVCEQAVVLLDEGGTPWRVVGTLQSSGRRGGRKQACSGFKGTELEQKLLSITHDIKSPTQSLLMSAHVLADAWADASRILAEDHREYGEFLLGGLPYTEMREVIPSLIDDIRRDAELIHRFANDLGEGAGANGDRFHINDVVTQALRVLRYR
ncbi:MAG: PAS domain-containing protein, partial [Gammaproteobacteria bacterium]